MQTKFKFALQLLTYISRTKFNPSPSTDFSDYTLQLAGG